MKTQYCLRQYETPDGGELITSDTDREIILSQQDIWDIYRILSFQTESFDNSFTYRLNKIKTKLEKLEQSANAKPNLQAV